MYSPQTDVSDTCIKYTINYFQDWKMVEGTALENEEIFQSLFKLASD